MAYNPEARAQLDRLDGLPSDSGSGRALEVVNFVRGKIMNEQDVKVKADYVEPKTLQEAYNHPDPVQRKMWRDGIRKEFRDMINRKVWRKEQR